MSHWQTPPALDPRPVPTASKGLRAPGHTGTPEDCTALACVEARRVKAGVTRQRRARGGAEGAARALAREPVLLPVVSEPAPPAAPPAEGPSTLTLRVPVLELRPLTVRELILLAAADVAGDDTARDIPLGALVVRAWERSSDRFGLPGHENHYPHSARVMAKLSGEDGVCGSLGWLRATEPNTWRLTTKGRKRARDLRSLAVLLEARAAA